MVQDTVQLILWAIFGLFITWGIFFAYVGFKSVENSKKRRTAQAAKVMALVLGIFWIMLWVSAVVYNALELLGRV
jgi:hypothetical protein